MPPFRPINIALVGPRQGERGGGGASGGGESARAELFGGGVGGVRGREATLSWRRAPPPAERSNVVQPLLPDGPRPSLFSSPFLFSFPPRRVRSLARARIRTRWTDDGDGGKLTWANGRGGEESARDPPPRVFREEWRLRGYRPGTTLCCCERWCGRGESHRYRPRNSVGRRVEDLAGRWIDRVGNNLLPRRAGSEAAEFGDRRRRERANVGNWWTAAR